MKGDFSSAKQLPVSYLTRDRVLERILQLGKQVCFIKEFRRLQMRKVEAQIFVPDLRYGLKQTKRNNDTDDRSCLQNAFLLHRQPVDTIRHNVLHRARNADFIDSQSRPVCPLLTDQNSS